MIYSCFIGLFILSVLSGCTPEETKMITPRGQMGRNTEQYISDPDPDINVPKDTVFYANFPYGPGDRNVFDIYLPKSDTKTPLIVFIHGGGFVSGDKSAHLRYKNKIEKMLNLGVAFAAINYPLLIPPPGKEDMGVHKPLKNSTYCLQFLRHHHDLFNIDKDKVAAYGASAGAGTALWLGTHDDMKNDEALDPIEHESTRLSAVAVLETQATYDIVRWRDILANSGEDLETSFEKEMGNLLMFYGIDSMRQLRDPAIVAYRDDVDMLDLMDKDDAPVYIKCGGCKGYLHHESHSKAVMDQADLVGLNHTADIDKLGVQDASGSDWLDFLLDHLN